MDGHGRPGRLSTGSLLIVPCVGIPRRPWRLHAHGLPWGPGGFPGLSLLMVSRWGPGGIPGLSLPMISPCGGESQITTRQRKLLLERKLDALRWAILRPALAQVFSIPAIPAIFPIPGIDFSLTKNAQTYSGQFYSWLFLAIPGLGF